MKSLRVLLLLSLGIIPLASRASDRATSLRHDAQACVNAWNQGHYPQVVGCLSRRAVPNAHARAAVLAQIQDAFTYGNVQLNSVQLTLGRIEPPRKYHALYASVFPVVAVIKGPFLRITDTSYVLGVSEDGGNSWRFIPFIQCDAQELNRLYPEFERRIAVPAELAPDVEATLDY